MLTWQTLVIITLNILRFLVQKEKKLREMLGTGNCIINKLKKPKEDRSNQDLFFSKVDLKLVGRVLRMSKVKTDQLVWCRRKLSNIKFVERRICREPSFLLFPCWYWCCLFLDYSSYTTINHHCCHLQAISSCMQFASVHELFMPRVFCKLSESNSSNNEKLFLKLYIYILGIRCIGVSPPLSSIKFLVLLFLSFLCYNLEKEKKKKRKEKCSSCEREILHTDHSSSISSWPWAY